MKRKIALLLAVMTIFGAGLTACGDSSSSSGSSKSDSQSADSGKSASAVADELKEGIEFKDTLNERGVGMYDKIYGITEDMYKEGKIYIGSGGATAEEIACFEANDADGAAKIKEAFEKRVEKQKEAFKDYVPEELDKLGSAVIVTKGNSVYMCISNDDAKAKEIIG